VHLRDKSDYVWVTSVLTERISGQIILRNPDIANICFARQYIAMVGSGIIWILLECKKIGFKTSKWSDKNNILLLTFLVLHALWMRECK